VHRLLRLAPIVCLLLLDPISLLEINGSEKDAGRATLGRFTLPVCGYLLRPGDLRPRRTTNSILLEAARAPFLLLPPRGIYFWMCAKQRWRMYGHCGRASRAAPMRWPDASCILSHNGAYWGAAGGCAR